MERPETEQAERDDIKSLIFYFAERSRVITESIQLAMTIYIQEEVSGTDRTSPLRQGLVNQFKMDSLVVFISLRNYFWSFILNNSQNL